MHTRKRGFMRTLAAMTLCLLLYGCGQETEVLYEPDAASEETSAVTTLSSADSAPVETEPPSFLQQQLDEIFGGVEGSGRDRITQANMIGFTEMTDETTAPIEINDEALPVQDGTLQMELNLLLYTKDGADSDLSAVFVLCWNGQICDFSLDGKQSTNGVLYMDMQQNQELIVPFMVEDLPILEGENTFYFCYATYCAETGLYLSTGRYNGVYYADTAREGRETFPLAAEADLDASRMISVTDKDDAMREVTVAPDDRIGGSDVSFRVRANPTLYLNVANYRNAEGPSNRSGFAMLLIDGKLSPIWNDAYYAAVSASDTEYTRRYAVETAFQAGEKHNVLLVYAEMQDDKNPSGDTYVYMQECYCTVEE